jgi:hypothetical protein
LQAAKKERKSGGGQKKRLEDEEGRKRRRSERASAHTCSSYVEMEIDTAPVTAFAFL